MLLSVVRVVISVNEVDVCTKTKTKCIEPKLFDAKCARLACLLSFASLFSSFKINQIGKISGQFEKTY